VELRLLFHGGSSLLSRGYRTTAAEKKQAGAAETTGGGARAPPPFKRAARQGHAAARLKGIMCGNPQKNTLCHFRRMCYNKFNSYLLPAGGAAMQPLAHFKTITHHRHLVCRYCFRLGLYRQGLLHDLSKYAPCEFWRGAKYYQGYRSPNDAERQAERREPCLAAPKGHNRHHV